MKVNFRSIDKMPQENRYVTFFYDPDCEVLTGRLKFETVYDEVVPYFETITGKDKCPLEQCGWWVYTRELEDPFKLRGSIIPTEKLKGEKE